jgi:predicted ATPase/class 3 adenylate cyclase
VAGELPTGTVTFLFTDVEGSTTLLQELGDEAYADALAEHCTLLRQLFATHTGIEIDTQGDAFFCVFASARDAAACAHKAQERLAATPMRVRIGLHSGEAIVADDHYVGLEVHRAARIAAAGHGGQILVSASTAPRLEPNSFALRDLGEHRLKDLSAPLRIYQLGDETFPPLRTLHRTNLPIPATPFLGRQRELETVLGLASESRLLTLTGPGGTGKTRLALQVAGELADDFPGGVFWVPLAALREQSLVAPTVGASLGAEEGAGDVAESIAAAVSAPTLLLLDNCEHLLDGVASIVSPLLSRTKNVRVITTSREPLALAGEHVVQVDPLERSDAVALFAARAEAAGADELDHEAAARLCERLDDLPLAIELAAARTPALPAPLLLERLSNRLDLLRGTRDAEERQRTLEATIGWSYDLLTPEEQQVFRRMSVFVGSASLTAVEQVAEADLEDLASLVAKSLVRMAPTAHDPRYWMLETIREFAGAQLETQELAPLRERYIQWFGRLAAEAGPKLGERDAVEWLKRLDADVGNLRMAFWSAVKRGDNDAVALGTTLGEFHSLRGRFAEAQDTLTAALVLARTPLDEAKIHHRLGTALVRRSELSAATASYARADDLLGAPADGDPAWWRAWLDLRLEATMIHYWTADVPALHAALDELEPHIERHGTARQRASFLSSQVVEALRRERYVASDETEQLARASCEAAEAAGDWDGHFQLGFALLWRDKLDEASRHLRLGRDDAKSAGDALTEIRCLIYEAIAERKLGDVQAVRLLDAEIDELEDTYGYRSLIAANRAWLAWRDGDLEATEALGGAAVADWKSESRSGATIYQWSARFPLLAADVERDRFESASEQARFMLDQSQQPLRADVREAVEEALRTGSRGAFLHAVELAHTYGYT